MRRLVKGTARSVIVGPFVDLADGVTPLDSLTLGDITAAIIKGVTRSALTLTASGGDNDFTHVGDGYYSLELTAGNVDTAGHLRLTFRDDDVFLPVWEDFEVTAGDEAAEVHLCKAALVNKREHTVDTGVTVIKDDDGSTTLKTLTPSETGGVVTITPS